MVCYGELRKWNSPFPLLGHPWSHGFMKESAVVNKLINELSNLMRMGKGHELRLHQQTHMDKASEHRKICRKTKHLMAR